MREAHTFDDVLIIPKFSTVESRKDVNLDVKALGLHLSLPIISANMDSVTDANMAVAMAENGGVGCLHRFWDVETNVDKFVTVFHDHGHQVMCSVGLGQTELERADALVNAGCVSLIVDVANGASIGVVRQVKAMREVFGDNIAITVGNFASTEGVQTFLEHIGNSIEGLKIGIGPGSVCTTRIKTGVGYSQLSAIKEISYVLKNTGIITIADGGMKTPGDVAKALGAGANLAMLGGMLAGTTEAPGDTFTDRKFLQYGDLLTKPTHKKYRGSASKESYAVQGKDASWRTAEGESVLVPYKGPVKDVLQDIEGGLRSAFSYVGAHNLEEFHQKCEFVRVSSSTVVENRAHAK